MAGAGAKRTEKQDMSRARTPRIRRTRRLPTKDAAQDYATSAYGSEVRARRALYSEMVSEPVELTSRERYTDMYSDPRDIHYLRKARISHWEWRQYSNGESPEEDDEDEIPGVGILEKRGPKSHPARLGIGRIPAVVEGLQKDGKVR